jgi:DNA processing protein
LETGTVAVLAGGMDRPYPPENVPLMHEIVEKGGSIICEMPFGWEPRAQDFPRRNRIIAGLSLGLVVVEAAMRSGSLISARMAAELGRVVFAVPGSPLDPRSVGTNNLLKQGAVLATEAQDVFDHLEPMLGQERAPSPRFEEPADFTNAPSHSDDDRTTLTGLMGPTPTSVDDLIAHSRIHPANVHMILLELDLAGRLERHGGGLVSLVSDC